MRARKFPHISQERLRQLLRYDPETGCFYWLEDRQRSNAGDLAGAKQNTGYIHIWLDGTAYLAHRLAWLYTYGVVPAEEIDHENRNKTDNRLCNLRTANRVENARNTPLRSHNQWGTKGVYWCEDLGMWRARIGIGGRMRHLGYHPTRERAARAYREAAKLLHGDFACEE